MDTASINRMRIDEPSAGDEDGGDCVIGLDVGGQLLYTHKSTLTAGSAYFAARFGGAFSAGESYEDERGRKVYFVDADAKTFEHIITYLRRSVSSWPDMAEDPKFYKRLVAEAEYFGVESMLDELQGSACIAPNASGKGILYWLGTTRHKTEYQNPYKMNKIRVEHANSNDAFRAANGDVSDFFEYRPLCSSFLANLCTMFWCDLQFGGSRYFYFVDVAVKPTHYSLRYGCCCGMSDWNFEASVDGSSWDILHKARKDRHLLQPSSDEFGNLPTDDDADFVAIAEERHRHTWEVSASSYYQYFRFVSLTKKQLTSKTLYGNANTFDEGPTGRALFSECLHGVGFELYGDVKPAKTTS